MAVQFVLGSSGSGKSEYLYKLVTEQANLHPKKNYLVIVPEQFTLSTQQKLVELSPNQGIMNVDVLSFKRLAYRVFDDLGMSELNLLEETGKNLLLRRVAKEQNDNLQVLRHNMSRMGYVEQLKSFISELYQYNVTPDMLKELSAGKGLSKSFLLKANDISLLYEEFMKKIKGQYVLSEQILTILSQHVKESELLKGAVLVLDEFTGFTPIQYDLLREILPIVEMMYIPLSIEAKEASNPTKGMDDLFNMTKVTIDKMTRIAYETNVVVKQQMVMPSPSERRFAGRKALAHLEENLFRPYYSKYNEPVDEIKLYHAKTPKEELTFVAEEISRLVRDESNHYRYYDFAIVTGALENYSVYASEIFEKYALPLFVDESSNITYSTFVDCIRSMLRFVAYDFNYDELMQFLRSGYLSYRDEEIDELDNYLIATGISHVSQWKKSWLGRKGKSKDFDLIKMDELRLSLLELLQPLLLVKENKTSTNHDAIVAIYAVLKSLSMAEKLHEQSEEYLNLGMQEKSSGYAQIYEKVMNLFEKYDELLGDETFDMDSFIELFDAGISAIKLGVTPPGYDTITLGDIERTRLNGKKILFFVGINDGIIPKSENASGIISEYERQNLLDSGMELAPGLKEKAFIQRYYLYRNLTKPSEFLYLSYATSDSDGGALSSSYLIKMIQKMFPNLLDQSYEGASGRNAFYSKSVALEYLAHHERDDWWYSAASALKEEPIAQGILAAPFKRYEHEAISKNVARVLYGEDMNSSITQVEKFFGCAYKYFLSYGIRLKDREEAGLSTGDVGSLYHKALEKVGQELKKDDSWTKISDEDRDALADRALDEAILELNHTEFMESSSAQLHQLNRMKEIFRRNVWVIVQQISSGDFRPEQFEVNFDGKDKDMLCYSLSDGRLMNVRGTIDRVDTYHSDGKIYVKIVDYKTGSTKFNLDELYYGLQLQLAVYMNAATKMQEAYLQKHHMEHTEVLPGAMLYQHIDDPVLGEGGDFLKELRPTGQVLDQEEAYVAMDHELMNESTTSRIIPVSINKGNVLSYKKSTVLPSEGFEMLSEYAIEKMKEAGNRIYAGEVSVNPVDAESSSCKYCPFKGVCGFDHKIPGYEYRKQKKIGSGEDAMLALETELELLKLRNK